MPAAAFGFVNSNRSPRPFTPPNEVATYRDLLLFEERLKSNAMNLQSRKSRYQLFLVHLLMLILLLTVEVLLPPEISILVVPYRTAMRTFLPWFFPPDKQVTVHPYFSTGLLFVSVTTLVLFFASGMYKEKMLYANKYVPHANRALRSFNMYLNVRKPPLASKFRFNPLSFFFPRPAPPLPPQSSSRRARSPSAPPGASIPIPEIPPASNPRGELIFSSRVDRAFRDGYEKHRAAFERRREEKERVERGEGFGGVVWRIVGLVTGDRWGGKSLEGKVAAATGREAGALPLKGTSSGSSISSVRRAAMGTGTIPGGGKGIVMKSKRRDRSLSPPGEGYLRREVKIKAVGMERSPSQSPERLQAV